MSKIKKFVSETYASYWVLLLALVISGGFNEYISCALSTIISILMIVKIVRNKIFIVNINIVSVSVAVIALFYLISCFYAIDSGMAFVGFLKFLPVLLYMLLLMQYKRVKEQLIGLLPYTALVLGVLSLIFAYIPVTRHYFTVSSRLAGFFQYPNTFALFLLIGELILLSKNKMKATEIISASLLIVLLLFTGSRAVFVLAVVSNFLIIFLKKGKKSKVILCTVLALLVVTVISILPLLQNTEIFSRYFSISFNESTFIGRFLYYTDAFPVILKHPFGLGYMGYYYIQQSIQTGLYSVKFIHNDILQILLDIGWIPCLLFVIGVIKSFLGKNKLLSRRIILLTFFLHCIFDFDLQFTAMFFVLLLFIDYDEGKRLEIQKGRAGIILSFAVTEILSFYFAVALALAYYGCNVAADSMFPGNTQNKIDLLISEDDISAQNEIADRIISQNEYVQIAYSAKARYAYSQGDFEHLIEYKQHIFSIAPFSYEEYEDYCYMMIQGIQLYKQAGDEYSAEICEQQLLKTADKLYSLDAKLSSFGKKIVDQPKTELPDDIVEYINCLEN